MEKCRRICCEMPHCHLAFMLSSNCFSVACKSADACKTQSANPSRYNPKISYVRDYKTNTLLGKSYHKLTCFKQTRREWKGELSCGKDLMIGTRGETVSLRLLPSKLCRSRSLNNAIFHSFEGASESSSKKISHFPKRMKPNLFNRLSMAPEVNAQRNKPSLLATKSSGIAHFWMTHLNRREVVMATSSVDFFNKHAAGNVLE